MTSKERLKATLEHRQPDRVCVDLGATMITGISASAVAKLRERLLGEKGYRVKIVEPYQMLGEVDGRLREALGVDVVGLMGRTNFFGFENTDWKPFTLFDGTDLLVPGDFNVTVDENGDLLIYPEGDTSAPPSGRMPKGGFYFDAIIRQEPLNDHELDPADNCEEFSLLSDEEIRDFADRGEALASGGKVLDDSKVYTTMTKLYYMAST